jgi:L-fuconolactonase
VERDTWQLYTNFWSTWMRPARRFLLIQKIDAHHHLWRFTPQEFDWLEGSLEPLRRDFLPPDLAAAMNSAGIDGAVAVQARQTLEETHWLLQLAAETPLIRGVVGWAPLADESFSVTLAALLEHSRLKGLRHIIQGEPDADFILRKDFNAGIRLLKDTGLVYDILIFERQMPQTIRFVDQHPEQIFVLDHVAKPRIAAGRLEPWATNLRELARRPNIFCKLSGMVTEADPKRWTAEQLTPYFDVAVESFGPARLLAGSDWPVCLAGTSYAGWFDVLREFFKHYSNTEQAAIFGETATSVYSLQRGTPC